MKSTQVTREQLLTVVDTVYDWSAKEAFAGYNKHDGLNSPLLHTLLGWSKWPRMVAIQAVMRFPINLRPLLLVSKTRNPKGLALFAQGAIQLYESTAEQRWKTLAETLLGYLLESRVSCGEGQAWGYPYDWQDPGFHAKQGTPNAVVTAFVCEALLAGWRLTGRADYLDAVKDTVPFFLNELTVLKDTPEELCVGYMPLPMTMRVMDVSILIGSVLAQLGQLQQDDSLQQTARRMVTYVVNRQTDYGAWYYTDPPGDSHITHDNYHTGFILDALWRYMEITGDHEHESAYWKGLAFYAENHFETDGAPRWMHDKPWPRDIHGAAQGVITFSRHQEQYPDLADRVLSWSLNHMYHREGRFFYQQTRYFTKRFTLLRWCNGWMALALATRLGDLS